VSKKPAMGTETPEQTNDLVPFPVILKTLCKGITLPVNGRLLFRFLDINQYFPHVTVCLSRRFVDLKIISGARHKTLKQKER